MNDKSNQAYKELTIPFFKEVFDIIDRVLTQLDIPYYLVGANATHLQLLKEGTYQMRGTKDIDFAIMISSIEQYEIVVSELKEKGFETLRDPWTLYHPSLKWQSICSLLGRLKKKARQVLING